MAFICSICEENSTRICVRCTKDTCGNHLCEKCGQCSDCCSCELRLDSPVIERETVHMHTADIDERPMVREAAGPHEPTPEPHPMPDPDPAPEPEPIPEYPR